MRTLPRNGLLMAVTLLVPLTLAPTALKAQQKASASSATCNARTIPASLMPGSKAARVAVILSSPIGNVSDFQPADGSGLQLASPADMPMVGMANEGKKSEKPAPIQMANQNNRLTLWLNTSDAHPGTYNFTLKGEQGTCSGDLQVTKGS